MLHQDCGIQLCPPGVTPFRPSDTLRVLADDLRTPRAQYAIVKDLFSKGSIITKFLGAPMETRDGQVRMLPGWVW